jgi:hypothetical protein
MGNGWASLKTAAGNISNSVTNIGSSFASGYSNAATGYYGSVYSYVPPAAPAFFANSASSSIPQTSGGGETSNPGVPPPPADVPKIPEGATEDDLANILSDDYDSAEFRYALHEKSGQEYWQYKFRWSNGVVVRIHQGLEPWRRSSEVVANVAYEVPPGSVTPFTTDLGVIEYVINTQSHVTINSTLELLMNLFGFGY